MPETGTYLGPDSVQPASVIASAAVTVHTAAEPGPTTERFSRGGADARVEELVARGSWDEEMATKNTKRGDEEMEGWCCSRTPHPQPLSSDFSARNTESTGRRGAG